MKIKLENVLAVLSLVGLGLLFYWGIKTEVLTDQTKMHHFVSQFGTFSVVVIILLQMLQVVFPVIPGGIGMIVATLIFGIWWGFVINYVSIVLGSIIAFLIARKYGKPLVKRFFSKKLFDKYEALLDHQETFDKVFLVSILMPIAPDDFLCYLAGITQMDFKKFVLILLLAKPPTTFLYSFGLHKVFDMIKKWLQLGASLGLF